MNQGGIRQRLGIVPSKIGGEERKKKPDEKPDKNRKIETPGKGNEEKEPAGSDVSHVRSTSGLGKSRGKGKDSDGGKNPEKKDGKSDVSAEKPAKPLGQNMTTCWFYHHGGCKNGEKCTFRHVADALSKECCKLCGFLLSDHADKEGGGKICPTERKPNS